MEGDNIQLGHYVIIQRQKYMKLFKFNNLNSQTTLGKDQVMLKNINEHPYSSTFKMIPHKQGNKRIIDLEACSDVSSLKESINVTESGADNRHLLDNGETQSLTHNDIAKLRQSGSSASEIVGTIIENSKSFNTKTEYSQDKYLRKKEKKYFEFLQIRRPCIRLLADIMYRQDPEKMLGLRVDSLSQLIGYSNVSAFGNYLLYESGTNGLVPAAFLNAIGAKTEAQLLHLHQGNVPQKQALLALNLEDEQLNRCISANIYSILRQYYQRDGGLKRKLDDLDESENPQAKIPRTVNETTMEVEPHDNSENNSEAENGQKEEGNKTPKWMVENERGCELLRQNMDGLIVVSKEHPVSILKALLPFVKPGRPVVIFNLSRDILMETFLELKSSGVNALKMTSNWFRMYQVLPNRTHPDVIMNGNSGFILHGYTVNN